MALSLGRLINVHDYIIENLGDARSENLFLFNTVWSLIALTTFYTYVALSLGPKLMEKREPFKLDKVVIVYNFLQSTYSLVLAVLAGVYAVPYSNFFCAPVDDSLPYASLNWKLFYAYFISKIIDLLDTIFFILKKSNRQISFLHVYHHSMMIFGAWLGLKFVPGGSSTYLLFLNSAVHAVMYGYYMLTVTSKRSKIVWLKRHITHLQLIQFGLLVGAFASALTSNCGYPKGIGMFVLVQDAIMFVLFADFYYKSYIKPGGIVKVPSKSH